MKCILTITTAILIISNLWAQSPEKMSYQAIIRNSSNDLVSNTKVGMQISIISGTADGAAIYTETQSPTTNSNGLVSLEIGGDAATVILGDFSTIEWSSGTYFVKTETDPTGGTSYTITGTSQLLSVPYALHAKTAENVTGEITYNETDPLFNTSIASGITQADISSWNDKLDIEVDGSITNEIQNLSQVLIESNDGGAVQIKNIADPTDNQDVATKTYVDKLETKLAKIENMLIDAGLFKVYDVDGNSYSTVKIGDQLWMSENLKTTKYKNGIQIPKVSSGDDWIKLSSGAYCWYDNDSLGYANKYGALYNGYALDTDNLCPDGWHVPTTEEWQILNAYLGYNSVAGGKLKETGTINWTTPNSGATNETGFKALPGGQRAINTNYVNVNYKGVWWGGIGNSNSLITLSYDDDDLEIMYYLSRNLGASVRCLKD